MNRSSQNSSPPESWRTGPDYGAYSNRLNDRNRMASMFPLYLPVGGGPLVGEADHDPWWWLRESIPGGPVSIGSFSAPLRFQNQNQFQDIGATRTTIGRLPVVDPPPSFHGLKKEIYNPIPKWLTRRPNLYYRDNPIHTENAKEEDGKRCAICLEDFEPKEVVTVTPCNHMFHQECILPWVTSQGQCPVCRFKI